MIIAQWKNWSLWSFCVVVSDADTYDEISTSDPVVINFAN